MTLKVLLIHMKYIARSHLKSNAVSKAELQGPKQSEDSSMKSSKSFKGGSLKGELELMGENDLSLHGPQTRAADSRKSCPTP